MTTLSQLTHAAAADRIAAFASEGRLRTGMWHGRDGDGNGGRELACLLGAIHSDIGDASACPAHLMPEWMATITVTLFDGAGASHAADLGVRYAAAMRAWSRLDDAAWDGIKTQYLIRCVELALAKADPVASGLAVWTEVHAASQMVVAALRAGDADLLIGAVSAVHAAVHAAHAAVHAADAAHAAARAAARAANAAARAAVHAAHAAARAAADAAHAAAHAAHAAARAAADAAHAAARAAADAASYDLFVALLDDIRHASGEVSP